jgi:hypothetical protein
MLPLSMGFSDLLHGVCKLGSEYIDDRSAGIVPHASALCSLSTITFFGARSQLSVRPVWAMEGGWPPAHDRVMF